MSGKVVLKIAKNLLFLFAGLGMLYLAFQGHDLEELLNDIKQAKFGWIILSMVLGIGAFVSRGLRWIILLEPMGYKARISSSVYSIIIG